MPSHRRHHAQVGIALHADPRLSKTPYCFGHTRYDRINTENYPEQPEAMFKELKKTR
jgi:hypothetical protein